MSLATTAMRNFLRRHGRSRILGGDYDGVLVMSATTEDGVPKHGPRCHQTHQGAHHFNCPKDLVYSLCIGTPAVRQYDKCMKNHPSDGRRRRFAESEWYWEFSQFGGQVELGSPGAGDGPVVAAIPIAVTERPLSLAEIDETVRSIFAQ